jgi:hypothetical protein
MRWLNYSSVLLQVLNSDRIVCPQKYVYGKNTLCRYSTKCLKSFTPSVRCESNFIKLLELFGVRL